MDGPGDGVPALCGDDGEGVHGEDVAEDGEEAGDAAAYAWGTEKRVLV